MNKSTGKKRICVIAVVFYVLAVIMLGLACYFGNDALQYVKEYAEGYGMSVSSMAKDAFGYIMQAALPYVVYAIICFGFGLVLSKLHALKAMLMADDTEAVAEAAVAATEEAVIEAEEAVEAAEESVEAAEEAVIEMEEVVEETEEAAAEAIEETEEAAAEAIEETEEAAAEAALETIEEAEPKEE